MRRSRFLLAAVLAAVVLTTIGCDQATKHVARTRLDGAAPISLLGGAVRIVLMENAGAFLSLGSSLPPRLRAAAFLVGVGGVLLVSAVYLVFAFGPAIEARSPTESGPATRAGATGVDGCGAPVPNQSGPATRAGATRESRSGARAGMAVLPYSALACAWLAWAGGFSNLVDRVFFEGRVTDFVILGVGPLHTGVFNVADVAIVAGALGIAFTALTHASEAPAANGGEVPGSAPTEPRS